jgi:hypothetical protein
VVTLRQAESALALGVHFETAAPEGGTVSASKSLGGFAAVATFQFVVLGVVIELKAQVRPSRFHHKLVAISDELNPCWIIGNAVNNNHLVT